MKIKSNEYRISIIQNQFSGYDAGRNRQENVRLQPSILAGLAVANYLDRAAYDFPLTNPPVMDRMIAHLETAKKGDDIYFCFYGSRSKKPAQIMLT